MSINKIIGIRIREYRKQQGFSQEKLAELADLHRNYIGLVERGEINVTLKNVHKLSLILKVPLHTLLKDF